jgi:acyl-CoA synthetase (AMP-forming)/AMP-acid ligase II
MLLDAARRTPHATALIDAPTGEVWTYARLSEAVTRAAAGLALDRKGVVAWLSRSLADGVVGYLAALASGHAVLPVPANLHEHLLERLFDVYQPDLVVTLETETLPPGAARGYDAAPLETGGRPLRAWRRRARAAGTIHPDVRLLLSTSGSTGSPKMVRLTRANIESNALGIVAALHLDARECAVASLPLHYSFGLSVLHSHLLAGARIVLTERTLFEPEFWQTMADHACTSFAGVPYMYGILRRIGFAGRAPASLRTLTQAGGKMSSELIREFAAVMGARGGVLYVMYGQTEATARITVLPPEQLGAKLGGVGYALPGGRLEIQHAEPGGHGDVVYYGPNVMLGYAESRDDLGRGDEQHGRLDTGDVGYLDADGCLFITGRRKRFAKVFGLRVSLDDIEARLAPLGPVAAAGGDDAVAVFTVPAAVEAVRQALAELGREMRVHASAFRVRTVAELPLLPSGKVDYARLAAAGGQESTT